MKFPKILTLDIETNQHRGRFWGTFKQNIDPMRIDSPTRTLTWSAKWLGGAAVAMHEDDPQFLERLYDMLDKADAVITYNGDGFDLPHLRREFIRAGYPPLRPIVSIDLYRIVKKLFKLPSYRLDYVAYWLFDERKLETGGIGLWDGVEAGEEKAIRKMLRYNIKDVRLTERVYKHIKPWMTNHPHLLNKDVFIDDAHVDYACASCGSKHVSRERPRRTRCYAIRLVRCTNCGHWQDGKRTKL